jgi:hypothetical protein
VKRIASLLATVGVVAAALIPSSASAYTVPNLAAVTTPDQQVAVAFADNPTRAAMDQAGAFSTELQSFGFIGIPNYDPTSVDGSTLVCEMPQSPSGLWVVYGIEGVGVQEAIGVCQFMSEQGHFVRWRLNG